MILKGKPPVTISKVLFKPKVYVNDFINYTEGGRRKGLVCNTNNVS